MMRHGIAVCSIAVLALLLSGEALMAQRRTSSPERISSRDAARYQQDIDRIERVARRLLEAVPRPPRVQFLLAAGEPAVNAGATFGQVIVTSGMMDFLRTDDELAMILGHELAHITKGHVAQGAASNALLNIGSNLAGVFFPGAGLVTGVVGQLFLNHFNQSQELEADRVGLQYAIDAGYDPRAGEGVMRRMAEEVPQSATAHFFSSHPSSVERAAALRKIARDSPEHSHRSIPSRRTDTAVRFGRDEVACRQAKPHFYRALETMDLAEKAALYRQGLRQCPESPRAHFELAEIYIQMGQDYWAAAELREVLHYEPGNSRAQRRLREVERRLALERK